MRSRGSIAILTGFLILSAPIPSQAGLGGAGAINRQPSYANSFAFGPSFGWNLEKDAWYWGGMAEYGRSLNQRWTVSAGLTYERETQRTDDGADEATNTISFVGMINYGLTGNFSVSTGLAKGFLNDDNPDRKFGLQSGDWTTGLAVGLDIPLTDERSLFLSAAYEYNLTETEGTIGFDGGVSLGF